MGATRSDFMPVILGGDIGAYSLARSFHEEYGIKSLALTTAKSRMCDDSVIMDTELMAGMDDVPTFLSNLEGVAKRFPGKKLILLACGDWYVRLIVENKEFLQQYYVIPYIDEDLLNRLVLKDKFYELCDKVQVAYPRTYVYDCQNPPEKLELPFDYPVIAKPASSAEYHYAKFEGKKKVFKFNNQEDLEAMLGRLREGGYTYKFLIQDFIPGDDTYMRILTCYCDENSDVRFASFGQTILEDHGSQAIGNPVAIMNRVNNEVVAEAARLLKEAGYTGFANFDIKYDQRDNTYRFFEINTRLGRSNFYVTGSGFNTVKWIVDDLIDHKKFEGDMVVADAKALYSVVPRSVLNEYVKDADLKAEIDELYRQGKVKNPLRYAAETKLVRKLYPYISEYRHKKRFHETD